MRSRIHSLAWTFAACLVATTALAGGKYDEGASDTEIKIGNTNPYSGPASAYGMVGRVEEAYFRMINAQGGINGRKINFISYDDAYSPPKTVEQTRKLVESDGVLAVFSSIGTATSLAVQKYMNTKKVPQLFVASGLTLWGDYKNLPWSIGHQVNYDTEGRVFAQYLLEAQPKAKVGVLYQNDDLGKELLKGLKAGLGTKQSMIVVEIPYEVSQPTVDTEVLKIKGADVDVFVHFTSPKAAAQAIRKIGEMGWKPVQLVGKVASSIGAVMKPAGFEHAEGVISVSFTKEFGDPQWKDDPAMKAYSEFMDKYVPGVDKNNSLAVYGVMISENLVYLLKQCGDDLTRANVMKQAANIKGLELGLLLPGIRIDTSSTDYYPLEQLRLMRFEAGEWKLFGSVVEGKSEAPN